MKKLLLKFSLIGAALLLLVPTQSWAVMVDITIQNGSWNGFSATFIHKGATGGGEKIYGQLDGQLWGNLVTNNDGYLELTGINGLLQDTTGGHTANLTITDGNITSGKNGNAPNHAFGDFTYNLKSLTGPYNFDIMGGTFLFNATQPANFLTMDTLQLWGGDSSAAYQKCNNGGCWNKTGIGMDFRAVITEKPPQQTPEPATLALFGTGIAGLGLLRYRKSRGNK